MPPLLTQQGLKQVSLGGLPPMALDLRFERLTTATTGTKLLYNKILYFFSLYNQWMVEFRGDENRGWVGWRFGGACFTIQGS